MSQQPTDLSPEDLALLEDLKAYDNPEVFHDSTLEQIYKLTIRTTHLPDVSHILKIEINGIALPDAILETLLALFQRAPDFNEDIDKVRQEVLADPDYQGSELAMRRFFIRHLPKMIIHAYEILITMSILSLAVANTGEAEREKALRDTLKELMKNLNRDIKRMLGTRSSGRPKKYGEGENLPMIVNLVLSTASDIMGGRRGKDAVPGLKQIANKLGIPSADALGKQLRRAKHPWTGISAYLARME